MALDLDKYNDAVISWTRDIKGLFISRGESMGIVHRPDSPSPGASLNKFRERFRSNGGAISRVSISFPRVLIYTHKGAGKGRGGTKGSRWVDKYGNSKKTDPRSFGKMGTGGRTAKPFINDVLASPQGVDELATIAARELGDVLVGNLFIK